MTRTEQILDLARQQRRLLIEGMLGDASFDCASEPGNISGALETVIEANEELIAACKALLCQDS